MSNADSISISPVTRYQNAALKYYIGLTDSPFLHYGYWEPLPEPTEELTIGRLRVAQAAYADKLLGFIPTGVKSILDVGCGTGGNAAYLLDRGFNVEGLAPDSLQQELFLQRNRDRAVFHLTTFEDFKSTNSYDLILMSESSQYMSVLNIARCAAALSSNGSYLLLADMLRSDPDYQEGIFSNCHVVSELHTALEQAGFTLVKTEDISAQIAPTIDLCVDHFQRFGLKTIAYIADLTKIAVPPLHKLLRWAFNRWLKQSIVEGLAASELFERHLCYQIQLWQFTNHHES